MHGVQFLWRPEGSNRLAPFRIRFPMEAVCQTVSKRLAYTCSPKTAWFENVSAVLKKERASVLLEFSPRPSRRSMKGGKRMRSGTDRQH